MLELFAYLHSGEQTTAVTREAFDAARRWLGLPSPFGAGEAVDPRRRWRSGGCGRRPRRRRAPWRTRRRRPSTGSMWRSARRGRGISGRAPARAAGTLVANYLAARALGAVVIPPTIRFHHALPFFVADEAVDAGTGKCETDVPRGAPRPGDGGRLFRGHGGERRPQRRARHLARGRRLGQGGDHRPGDRRGAQSAGDDRAIEGRARAAVATGAAHRRWRGDRIVPVAAALRRRARTGPCRPLPPCRWATSVRRCRRSSRACAARLRQ